MSEEAAWRGGLEGRPEQGRGRARLRLSVPHHFLSLFLGHRREKEGNVTMWGWWQGRKERDSNTQAPGTSTDQRAAAGPAGTLGRQTFEQSASQSGGSKENYFLWEWIAIYGLRRDQESHRHIHTSLVLRWTYLDIGLCSAIVSWITLWTAHLDGSVWCICPHGVRAFLPCPLFCKSSASMRHLQIEQRTEKWEVKCATHTTDLPHSFN